MPSSTTLVPGGALGPNAAGGAVAGPAGAGANKKKQTGNVRKILYARKSLKDWIDELVRVPSRLHIARPSPPHHTVSALACSFYLVPVHMQCPYPRHRHLQTSSRIKIVRQTIADRSSPTTLDRLTSSQQRHSLPPLHARSALRVAISGGTLVRDVGSIRAI